MADVLTVGKVMNRDYRIVAEKNNFVIDKIRGDDLSTFPIEKARLRSIWYPLTIVVVSIAGYGWALHAEAVCISLKSEELLLRYDLLACCYSIGPPISDRGDYHGHLQYLWYPPG
jgi:hypothetical protein